MKDLVVVKHGKLPKPGRNSHINFSMVIDVAEAYKEGVLVLQPHSGPSAEIDEIKDIASETPNIALNVQGNTLHPGELWAWTLLGIALQSLTLAFPALATLSLQLATKGCCCTGICLQMLCSWHGAIVLGLLGCGYVIEASTTEYIFQLSKEESSKIEQIFRLQLECSVSSRYFPSCVIRNDESNMLIRKSRLNSTNCKKILPQIINSIFRLLGTD
jgi:hypothetical protein